MTCGEKRRFNGIISYLIIKLRRGIKFVEIIKVTIKIVISDQNEQINLTDISLSST